MASVYNQLENQLDHHNLMVSAAELHGVLSGLLCGGVESTQQQWLTKLTELTNDGHALPDDIRQLTQTLFDQASFQLKGENLDFRLLLPGDNCSLRERLQALTSWVEGFLVGFGVIRSDLKQCDEQIQELIRDFSEISRLSMELDEEDAEQNEAAYFEVSEYLRIGAITCFEQFNSRGTPSDSPTLH